MYQSELYSPLYMGLLSPRPGSPLNRRLGWLCKALPAGYNTADAKHVYQWILCKRFHFGAKCNHRMLQNALTYTHVGKVITGQRRGGRGRPRRFDHNGVKRYCDRLNIWAITISSDNGSDAPKAITIISDNGSNIPRAINIRSDNFSPRQQFGMQ